MADDEIDFVPIVPKPGLFRPSTEAFSKGRWYEADRMRFRDGLAETMGANERLVEQMFSGLCRGICSFRVASGDTVLAIGTHRKLYVLVGGRLSNITPLRASGTLGANPIATTSGSRTVVITHNTHGVSSGDAVFLSNVDPVAGLWFDGEYEATVIDANTYSIDHPVASATATTTGGGSAIAYAYEISPGLADNIDGFGYGVGAYGASTYGTPRTSASIELLCRTWSVLNDGARLYASPHAGSIYKWDSGDARATVLTNAPTEVTAMFMTQAGGLAALGANGNPLDVAISDADDKTVWTPDLANGAYSDTVKGGNRLVGGLQVRDGIDSLWTDTDKVALIHQPDSDLVYRIEKQGSGIGLVGPNAAIEHGGRAWWMGYNDFYMDAGAPRPIPNSADINNYVFGGVNNPQVNRRQLRKVFAFKSEANSEVGWLVPSVDSDELDRCVMVNTADYSWTVRTFDRTARLDSQELGYEIATSPDGRLYIEETGTLDDGIRTDGYIVLAAFDVNEGSDIIEVLALIPDFDDQDGPVEISLLSRERPQQGQMIEDGPVLAMPGQGQVDIRASGRQIAVKLKGRFRLGRLRIGIKKLGKR